VKVVAPKGKEVLVVEEDDFNAMETEETIEKEDVLALKIHSILVNKLIPELHKFLAKKEDESLVVRTPVALAITKLLQRMPLETLQTNLPKLVLTLCNILKSRQQSARDAAREVLVKMLIGLGVGYLGYFVKELYGVLTKGYQLHVLGYAIHSLLVGIAPTIDGQSKEMDGSVYLLVQIFVNDIFGEVGAEREVQELNGKMREIKKTMSFDSFELVASVMGMEKTMMLLNPLKELMLETSDPRVTQKIDTVLRRVAAGLNVNKSVEIRDLMVFIHALVNENLELSKLKEVTQKKGKGHRMLESNFCVTMKRPDATHQPLKHFQANAHRFVEFGYSLLLTSLKRGTLDVKDTAHLAMIEPMVNVLGKSLYSKHTSVLIAVIRIMSYVIKLPLKSVKIALPVIVKRLLEMVSRSSDTGSEIVQNSFRLLANVIRYCPEVEIKEHQLVVILDMIKPDLEDPDRQAVSFSLIRAVLSRKYVVEVVYDVMDLVAKILVTSQGSQVRALSRSAYLQFLTEYPQGEKRMEKQWNHVIMNLRYEHESGRESVMELLNSMFDKFPESVVEEYSEIVFLSLVVGLVNDDSSKCRNMAGMFRVNNI
jgi:U3 small nucleolar RNA-associated protein 20